MYFSPEKRIEVVGYPTRPSMQPVPKEEALAAFDLTPERLTLMVTGGSLGALSINRAVLANLEALLAEIQVIHLTGEHTWPEVAAAQETLAPELARYYRPYCLPA